MTSPELELQIVSALSLKSGWLDDGAGGEIAIPVGPPSLGRAGELLGYLEEATLPQVTRAAIERALSSLSDEELLDAQALIPEVEAS